MTRAQAVAAVLTAASFVAASCSTPPAPSAAEQPAQAASQVAPEPGSAAPWPTATPPRHPASRPAGPIPSPSTVDDTNPDAVSSAVVIAMYTLDANVDTGPTGAYRRAAAWLTADLNANLASAPQTSSRAWLDLAKHRGYTTVTDVRITREYGQPDDTAHVSYRTVTFTVATTYRDKAVEPASEQRVSHLRLDTDRGRWKVAGFLG